MNGYDLAIAGDTGLDYNKYDPFNGLSLLGFVAERGAIRIDSVETQQSNVQMIRILGKTRTTDLPGLPLQRQVAREIIENPDESSKRLVLEAEPVVSCGSKISDFLTFMNDQTGSTIVDSTQVSLSEGS